MSGKSKAEKLTQYGYGTGHIMNDMAGSLEKGFLLLFFVDVLQLGPIYAGIILSIGQVTCGISAVVVGILIDKTNFKLCNMYGKRKVYAVNGIT